jgi:hypothetical protein
MRRMSYHSARTSASTRRQELHEVRTIRFGRKDCAVNRVSQPRSNLPLITLQPIPLLPHPCDLPPVQTSVLFLKHMSLEPKMLRQPTSDVPKPHRSDFAAGVRFMERDTDLRMCLRPTLSRKMPRRTASLLTSKSYARHRLAELFPGNFLGVVLCRRGLGRPSAIFLVRRTSLRVRS